MMGIEYGLVKIHYISGGLNTDAAQRDVFLDRIAIGLMGHGRTPSFGARALTCN